MNIYEELIKWHSVSNQCCPIMEQHHGSFCISSDSSYVTYHFDEYNSYIRVLRERQIVRFVLDGDQIQIGPGRTLLFCNFNRANLAHFKARFVNILNLRPR